MTTAAVFERPKSGTKYHIEKLEDGAADVFRVPSDENDPVALVAKLRNGVVNYEDGMQRFDPVVRRRLNESKIPFNNVVLPEGKIPPPEPPPRNPVLGNKDPEKKEWLEKYGKSDSPIGVLNSEVKEAILWLRNKHQMPPVVETNPPPAPSTKKDGDKTPAYVEWLLRYKPDEFAKKYGVMRIGRVKREEPTIDPNTNKLVKRKWEETGVISKRKTHLTLKNDKHLIVDGGDE